MSILRITRLILFLTVYPNEVRVCADEEMFRHEIIKQNIKNSSITSPEAL
jgi:hypothetical protein